MERNQRANEAEDILILSSCYGLIVVAVLLGGWAVNLAGIKRFMLVPEAAGLKVAISTGITVVWLFVFLWLFKSIRFDQLKRTEAGKGCARALVLMIGLGLMISASCVFWVNAQNMAYSTRCQMEHIAPDRRRFFCRWLDDPIWYEAKDGDLLLYQVPPPK